MMNLGVRSMQDIVERLGDIPLWRIRMDPPPGTATEYDLLRLLEGDPKSHCELIDGTLVEKEVGTPESVMAGHIQSRLTIFADENDLGVVCGEGGPVRMLVGNVRIPDVSFFTWESLIDDKFPDDKICPVVPVLAVEVLSESNTLWEIERKRIELFRSGTKLMWIIDPETKTAEIYTSPTRCKVIEDDGVLDGGKVVPGFKLPLVDVFDSLKRKTRKRKGS